MARRAQGEGSVYYDASRKRWVGQAWIDGRRRKVSAPNKPDAAAKLATLIHGTPAQRAAISRLSLEQLLEDWQRHHLAARDLAPSTLNRHRWAAQLWTTHLGRVQATDLTPAHVRDALAAMDFATSSTTKVRATLVQALRWAEGQGLVARNAAAFADPPPAKPAKQKRALTSDELEALATAAQGHPLWPMFALSAYAGLRPGEAGAVCVDALDLEADPPTVAVIRGLQRQRSGAVVLVDDLKTAGARRTIAMPRHLAELLAAHINENDIRAGLLFTASNGGPVHGSTIRAELRQLCSAAKIASVSPNELRHTAATRMADAGLAPHELADVLGHRTTRMVDEVYRHRPPVVRGPDVVA